MKANRLVVILLLLLNAAAVQLLAQQTDADRKLFEEFKAKAKSGDVDAEHNLALCYANGRGIQTNIIEAARWHEKAANHGKFESCLELAELHALGCLGPDNKREAESWYLRALESAKEKGKWVEATVTTESSTNTITHYESFTNTARTVAIIIGVKLLNRSAESEITPATMHWLQWGLEDAIGGLGLVRACADGFRNGGENFSERIVANPQKFFALLQLCAEQGDAYDQTSLGLAYKEGIGVHKNPAKAFSWFKKAAEQGDGYGQETVAICYASGEGVPQDYVQAHKWYNLAAAQGRTTAAGNRDSIQRWMSVNQIAEAQRMAREFTPHKKSSSRDVGSPENPSASGTGFFISDDGYLISNHHVVEGANQVRLVTSAGLISAKVVKVDAANDLALLKAEGRFAALPVAASRGVKLGGTVATVGFPNIGLQGFAPKLAKGEIASLSGAGDDARYFQISVPVQPGNSGGALVDERGNVVGVVSAKLNAGAALRSSGALPENVNYAVKSSYLLSFLESVPDVASKLKEASGKEKKFEDVVKEAEQAAVLVLVY